MSQQNIVDKSWQINSSVAPVTILTDASGQPVPADIKKIILANSSATPTLVTLSDGVNNYYYNLPANGTIIDEDIESDRASTAWTITCATSVNSVWASVVVND